MNWITDILAIGNYLEGRSRASLTAEGIRGVLCLIASPEDIDADTLGVDAHEVVPLLDGPGNDIRVFRDAVSIVGELSETLPKVLVHCHAGKSRPVGVVAGHLIRTRGFTTQHALAYVVERREASVVGSGKSDPSHSGNSEPPADRVKVDPGEPAASSAKRPKRGRDA